MHQFDISQFSSQIFWLLICFSVIYLLAKKLFMPKMEKIIGNRADKIEHLRLETEKLNQKLSDINEKIESVRKDSIIKYSNIIADAKSKSNENRINFIKKNQEQISVLQNESNSLTQNILQDYSENSEVIIENLVRQISDKLVSKKIN
jgi:F-type H+-transporting ATPase subunit b